MAKKKKCIPEFEGKKFELVSYEITPKSLWCDELEKRGTLSYIYNVSEVNPDTCEVETKTYEKSIGMVRLSCYQDGKAPEKAIRLSDTVNVELTADDGEKVTTAISFTYGCEGCKNKCKEDVSVFVNEIYHSPLSATCKGGEIDYEVRYVVTKIDKDCNETMESGAYKPPTKFIVKPCDGNNCCDDHNVIFAEKFKYNKKTGVFDLYNPDDVIDDDYVTTTFSVPVFVKGDAQGECGKCECKSVSGETTYCVDKDSVNVMYITNDGEHEIWSESGIVPATGGTIVVSFDYNWYVTETDCSGNTILHTDKENYIDRIDIPACDCNADECGDITVETSFKNPHEDGCNVFTYTIRQETCKK